MVITTATQKGGTGKTTTAAALAQAAAHKGKKVLCVDLDPQGNFTFALDAQPARHGAYSLFNGATASDVIRTTSQKIDVIPASPDLATVTSGKGSARRIRRALEPIRGEYDYIFIDTPPTTAELQYNALMAADGLIIPLLADTYNVQSFFQITDVADAIRKRNPEIKTLGFILNMHDPRSKIVKHMEKAILENAEALGVPYLGSVRASVVIREAAALQISLYDHAPKSKPAQDFMRIFETIDSNNH